MAHNYIREEGGGVRITVDTLSDVAFFNKEVPEQVFCAGKICEHCGDPSIVMASLGMPREGGPNVRVTETFRLSDAEALAKHILAEIERLRSEGHVEVEGSHATAH